MLELLGRVLKNSKEVVDVLVEADPQYMRHQAMSSNWWNI